MTVAQPTLRTSKLFDETQHIFRKMEQIYFLITRNKSVPICLSHLSNSGFLNPADGKIATQRCDFSNP